MSVAGGLSLPLRGCRPASRAQGGAYESRQMVQVRLACLPVRVAVELLQPRLYRHGVRVHCGLEDHALRVLCRGGRSRHAGGPGPAVAVSRLAAL